MRFKKKSGFSMNSKRATTMFYSPLIYIASLILLIYLLIFVNQKRSLFQNRQVGGEAINMLLTQQEAEKARIYVEESAGFALKDGLNDFLNNGGQTQIEGIYSEVNDTNLSDNFIYLFRENFQKYLNSSPYLLNDNYILNLNTSKGIKIIGQAGYKKSFILKNPVPTDIIWPVDTYNDYYLITDKNGCYGNKVSRITNKAFFHHGIDAKPSQGNVNVYSIANNGKISDIDIKGNALGIDYGTFTAVYSNLAKINVNLGHKVNKGYTIGELSGKSDNNYLVFQILVNKKEINPLCYYPVEKIYYANNAKADCGVACEGGLYRLDLSFKTSDTFKFYKLIDFYDKIKNIKDYCYIKPDFKSCVDNNISQLKAAGFDIKEVNNGEQCEEGINKGFVGIAQSLNKCYYSKDDNCYCDISITKLIPSSSVKNDYYIDILTLSSKTGLLLFDGQSKSLLREIKLNFSSELLKDGKEVNLNINPLSIHVFSNKDPIMKIGRVSLQKDNLLINKSNGVLTFNIDNTASLKKCSPNNDLILLCYEGMKIGISRKHPLIQGNLNIK